MRCRPVAPADARGPRRARRRRQMGEDRLGHGAGVQGQRAAEDGHETHALRALAPVDADRAIAGPHEQVDGLTRVGAESVEAGAGDVDHRRALEPDGAGRERGRGRSGFETGVVGLHQEAGGLERLERAVGLVALDAQQRRHVRQPEPMRRDRERVQQLQRAQGRGDHVRVAVLVQVGRRGRGVSHHDMSAECKTPRASSQWSCRDLQPFAGRREGSARRPRHSTSMVVTSPKASSEPSNCAGSPTISTIARSGCSSARAASWTSAGEMSRTLAR